MSDSSHLSPFPVVADVANGQCNDASTCSRDGHACGEPQHHDHDHDHDHAAVKIDGAGEPCPTPLMWQEVRENYLRESQTWEIVRGPHRLVGRTWGEGPPLYLLNNFAGTAELFSLVLWILREQFRCVVFDAVTNDRAAARRTRPTMSEFADDLFAVADRHGDAEFLVYGAGFGAAMGLQAALNQPQRVNGLILQHGFARRKLTFFERTLASVCLRSGQTLDALPQRRRFQAVNHQMWFPPFDSSRFQFLIDSSGTLPLRDLARRALAIHSLDVTDQIGNVACPTMMLRTEGEGRQAADAQVILEQRLRQPRVEWLHSAGQHPYLTHPHRVAKLVQSFFPVETHS